MKFRVTISELSGTQHCCMFGGLGCCCFLFVFYLPPFKEYGRMHVDHRRSLCRAFCLCNPSLSASHSHHVHPRRSCTSCPSSPPRMSCTSSPSTSAPRASPTKRAGDRQPCGRAPAASGTHTLRTHTPVYTPLFSVVPKGQTLQL